MALWKSSNTLSFWLGRDQRHPCTDGPVSCFMVCAEWAFSPCLLMEFSWCARQTLHAEITLNMFGACSVVISSEIWINSPNAAYYCCNVSLIRKWRHVKWCAQGCRQGHKGSAGDWFLNPHVKTQAADNELQTHEQLYNILLDWYLK